MDTTRPKITFGVVDERYLFGIVPAELSKTERNILDNSLAIESRFGEFQKGRTTSCNHRSALVEWMPLQAFSFPHHLFRACRHREEYTRELLGYRIADLVDFKSRIIWGCV
jgi:hypothetical protein